MTQPPNAPPPPPAHQPGYQQQYQQPGTFHQPQYQQPGTYQQAQFQQPGPIQPPAPAQKRSLLPLWTGLAGLAIGAGVTALIFIGVGSASASREEAEERAAIQLAFDTCGLSSVSGAELGDDGTSATFYDVAGPSGPHPDDFECFIEYVKMPESIYNEMLQTRAIDGRQTATWDSYEVSWSFAGDDGLSAVIDYHEPSR